MNPTDNDFPAAHSMDTEWFAVDLDGNVARFDTGEDGALPERAATGLGCADPSFNIDELTALRVARTLANGTDPAGDWRTTVTAGRTLVVMDVESAEQALEAIGSCANQDHFAVLSTQAPFLLCSKDELSVSSVESIRELAAVRWTLDLRDSGELFSEGEGDDGMFHFDHEHGEDPGLYRMRRAPAQPLRFLQELRPVAEEVGGLQLAVRFSDVSELHLADLLSADEVQTYGDLPLRYSDAEREGDKPLDPKAAAELREAKLKLALLLLAFIGVVLWLWFRA